jgi:isoaspartyl peptidase/L-asparaginase-like protein (Ntn-hydrolase superfamily)
MVGEASLGEGGFGAVGAVSGVRSPITLAHAIMTAERKGRLPLGRVPPMYRARSHQALQT